jgi:hypothetical protein
LDRLEAARADIISRLAIAPPHEIGVAAKSRRVTPASRLLAEGIAETTLGLGFIEADVVALLTDVLDILRSRDYSCKLVSCTVAQ